jgi:hypothetical protein
MSCVCAVGGVSRMREFFFANLNTACVPEVECNTANIGLEDRLDANVVKATRAFAREVLGG